MLQDLVKYYDILAKDKESDICAVGYGEAKISYAINISEQGELLNLVSIKVPDISGKKYIAPSKIVPEPVKRSRNAIANFLWDNSSFVFGFDKKGNPKHTMDCFNAFKQHNMQILKNVDNQEAYAVIQFLDNWNPEIASEHPKLKDYLDDILGGANFVFRLDDRDHYIHENEDIVKAWDYYKTQCISSVEGMCMLLGEKLPIARLHPVIKGIKGGQAMGNTLISYNDNAYESYGYDDLQGYNASISERAAFEYGTVLNKLLADSEHKIYIGDTTVVFWAESTHKVYQDVVLNWLNPSPASIKEEGRESKSGNKEVRSILKHIKDGIAKNEKVEEGITFCILGLAPNAARISIRFYIKDTFGNTLSNLEKHYEDLQIEKQFADDMNLIPVWKILAETISKKSTNKDASPLLSGAVMRAILQGTKYPDILYQAIIMRIRAEHDINYYKASIIKACLIRKKYLSESQRGGLTMSLNSECMNTAYVLGRLFAVLEKIQIDGVTSINTTIKDKYFNSACANPANVFPMLLKLSNHHLNRIEDKYRISDEKKLREIMDIMQVEENSNPFPKNLSYDDQGLFVIGYYHQKNDLYKKKEEK